MDISTAIHYYEAILASLAILVWHYYFIFINPDVYPMNKAWYKGYITREQMQHEHPLELEQIEILDKSNDIKDIADAEELADDKYNDNNEKKSVTDELTDTYKSNGLQILDSPDNDNRKEKKITLKKINKIKIA